MKKLSTELLTLCDHAITSQQGKLSIIGLFDRIFVTQVPTKYPRFFVVAILKGESNSSCDVSLSVETPSGKSLLPPRTVQVNLGANGKANVLTDIANLTMQEIGEYKLRILSEAKEVGVSSFFVTKVTPQKEEANKN